MFTVGALVFERFFDDFCFFAIFNKRLSITSMMSMRKV
jgi:hypothetical protein